MTLRQETAGMHVLVALGGNLPWESQPPAATLAAALRAIDGVGLPVLRASRFFVTPCFPPGAGPDYVNAAAVVAAPAGMGPEDVLARLHRVEAQFGRARAGRWSGRTLDLDLIAFGRMVLPDAATQDAWRGLSPEAQRTTAPDRLILPHPRLQDRAFVLVPLAEVAPDWKHPRLGLTVADLLAALSPQARAEVVALDGPDPANPPA